jgi:hypothetical protein
MNMNLAIENSRESSENSWAPRQGARGKLAEVDGKSVQKIWLVSGGCVETHQNAADHALAPPRWEA